MNKVHIWQLTCDWSQSTPEVIFWCQLQACLWTEAGAFAGKMQV